jgi:hypothetical protein
MIQVFWKTLIASVALFFSFAPQAALYDRGGGLIYDDVLNVTWLKDINYAQTSGFDDDGAMSFDDAQAWAQSLNYFDSVRNRSYSGWRLPSMDVNGDGQFIDCGLNIAACADNELGHLYYIDGVSTTAPNPFFNIQPSAYNVYWSTTPFDDNRNYVFLFNGLYDLRDTQFSAWTWAVHDGDISAVPVPATAWLFVSGIVGLFSFGRRRRS